MIYFGFELIDYLLVDDDPCLTPYCIKAGLLNLKESIELFYFEYCIANLLLDSIDETVQPCENFFEFACGNWIKKNRIPEDGKSTNLFYI